MGSVQATMNLSIDACCDHTQVIADDEFHTKIAELFAQADALLFGRTTYELLYSYWPKVTSDHQSTAAEKRLAEILDDKPKYVVTSRDRSFDWNAKRTDGDVETLRSIKAQTDGMILLVASPTLAQTLVQWNLIDTYHIAVSPIVAGHGPTFLSGVQKDVRARFLGAEQLRSGVVIQRYGFESQPVTV